MYVYISHLRCIHIEIFPRRFLWWSRCRRMWRWGWVASSVISSTCWLIIYRWWWYENFKQSGSCFCLRYIDKKILRKLWGFGLMKQEISKWRDFQWIFCSLRRNVIIYLHFVTVHVDPLEQMLILHKTNQYIQLNIKFAILKCLNILSIIEKKIT